MIGAIATIISTLVGGAKQAYSRYQERKIEENKTYLALEKAKQELASKQVEYNHKLRLEQLKSTPKWFKIFTFISWALPMYITIVVPDYGAQIFERLELMPQWYVQSYIILMFTVWGIAISKQSIASLMDNFLSAWNYRKYAKYAGKTGQLVEAPEKTLTDKVLFDIIRSKAGNLTQEDVDTVNRIINK